MRRADCDALAETCASLQHLLLDPSPHDLHIAPVIRACRSLRALMLDDPPPDLYTLDVEFLWFSSVLEPSAPLPLLRSLCMNCHLTPRFGPLLALHASNLQVHNLHTFVFPIFVHVVFLLLLTRACTCFLLRMNCLLTPRFGPSLALHASNPQVILTHNVLLFDANLSACVFYLDGWMHGASVYIV